MLLRDCAEKKLHASAVERGDYFVDVVADQAEARFPRKVLDDSPQRLLGECRHLINFVQNYDLKFWIPLTDELNFLLGVLLHHVTHLLDSPLITRVELVHSFAIVCRSKQLASE